MKQDENEPSDAEVSVSELVQQIESGNTDPRHFDPRTRQRCVEYFVAEGYTVHQMAQVLKRNEKTIDRDLKDINVRHALSPSVEAAKQFVGQVVQKAMSHHSHLVRLARTKGGTTGEKVQAEFAAWKVIKELVEKLQTLGYLPQKPTEVVGTFFHHNRDGEDSPAEVGKMLADLEQGAREAGVLDEVIIRKIDGLRKRIEQAGIAADVRLLQQETIDKEREQDHEQQSE